MLDLFDSLFDFDRKYYTFRRSEKDMAPYSIIKQKEKGKTILVHNILGINKDDLSVTVKTENGHKILYISGETKDEVTEQSYSVNSRFTLGNVDNIDNITSECKNGLLYIHLFKKEIEKPVIKKEEAAKPDSSFIEVNKPYEQMDIKELQDAILAKMAKNGPITDQMLKSVRENIYHDSLINWVKSFR